MKKQYEALRAAIEAFEPRFSMVKPDKSPIPLEGTLAEVVAELKAALVAGFPVHPPKEIMIEGNFNGYQLIASEPIMQGQTSAKPVLRVNIHTDMVCKTCLTDQRVIAHGIIAVVIAEWVEDTDTAEAAAAQKRQNEAMAKAKEAEATAAAGGAKPEDKVTPFPAQ